MSRYLVRRLLLTIPVIVGVATLVFSLIHLVPGDPVRAMLGDSASQSDVAEMRGRLGLDRPLYIQYGSFMKGAATGNLGTSLRTNQPVAALILDRLPATFELAMAAMCASLVIALPLGIIAAVKRGTAVDHAATTVALMGMSIPNFWLGPLLAIVFSVSLGWLPVSGRGTLANLILPAMTLGAPLAAVLARMTRASLIEELGEIYVLAARARGVSRTRAVLKHAFRNSLIPIVTVIGAAVRIGAHGRRDHGNDFRVARHRPAARAVDQRARLSGGAGLHPADCDHLRLHERDRRRRLRIPRSADPV